MKPLELFKREEKRLVEAEKEYSKSDLVMLFEYFLGLKRFEILTSNQDLRDEEISLITQKVDLRLKNIPCQYIIGETEFLGHRIMLDENVLIPRLDTERLVEEALRLASQNAAVLDLCTGSGIIAISLKSKRRDLSVCASDISKSALDIAEKNARLNEVDVEFIQSDMFSGLFGRHFDLICSNPPYISSEELLELSGDVRSEPSLALFGGDDGLDFYRIIAENAKNHLNKSGRIALEIGYKQADSIMALLERDFENIRLIKDYSGIDRVISAELKKGNE